MLYGIFSDIHSNLEALNIVLRYFDNKQVDRYICAGDVVGYGPDPNECVRIVKGISPLSICVGNHDRAACGLKDMTWFNDYARQSLVWTSRVLTEVNNIYLSELPKSVLIDEFMVVHGSPRDPVDEYLMAHRQFEEIIPQLKKHIVVVGHTHIPTIFGHESAFTLKDASPVRLEISNNYLINPGSVGQPRDGNNKASCALFNTETRELELIRLEYDITKTQSKMRALKLPPYLIERLSWGN